SIAEDDDRRPRSLTRTRRRRPPSVRARNERSGMFPGSVTGGWEDGIMSDEANSSDRLEAAASTAVSGTTSMRVSGMSATDALGAQASTRAVANAIRPDVDRSIAAL